MVSKFLGSDYGQGKFRVIVKVRIRLVVRVVVLV